MSVCLKRTVAALLCCSFLAGMTACSSNNGRMVLNAAEGLGIAVTKRNMSSIEELASEDVSDLADIISFADSTSEDDLRVKEKIASTLTYTVDQESLTGNKKGSVDIVFSYIDYESICSDISNMGSADTFERAVDGSGDMTEVTLKFDFELKDDKVTFSGLDQLSDLFPYAEEEFDFTVDYPSFVDGICFTGDCYDQAANTYTDSYGIHAYMEISPEGQSLDWSYTYSIDRNGDNIYTSSTLNSDDGQYLNAAYSSAARLEDGAYTVSFYSEDGQFLGSSTVEVITTITPGTPQDISSYSLFYDSPYFVVPDDNVILLPDSDVTITLPDEYTCQDFNYFLSSDIGYTDHADNTVFFACTDDRSAYALAIRLDFTNYESQEAYDYIGFVDDGQAVIDTEFSEDESAWSEEYFQTIGQYDYSVAGRRFRCLEINYVGASTGVVMTDYFLVGDEDTCYVFIVSRSFTLEDYGTNDYSADDILPFISVG